MFINKTWRYTDTVLCVSMCVKLLSGTLLACGSFHSYNKNYFVVGVSGDQEYPCHMPKQIQTILTVLCVLQANPKSDVWSLGCILYRMIYKKTPFHQFTDPIAKFCAIVDDRQEIPFPPISSTSTLSVLKVVAYYESMYLLLVLCFW